MSHINPEAPGKVSDSCARTLCHLLSCSEVKGTYSQGSAMWASFFKPEQRAQNPNPYFISSDLLTHLDERIVGLCSAANRWREHTVLCLKVGNADEMRTIILSVYQQRQLLLGELAPCSHAASRGVNRFCTNSDTSVSCIWTSWTQGKWFHERLQIAATPAHFLYQRGYDALKLN